MGCERVCSAGRYTTCRRSSVSHDQVRVKAQGCVDDKLASGGCQQGGQPAGLACVQQLEDHIVLLYQLLQPLGAGLHLRTHHQLVLLGITVATRCPVTRAALEASLSGHKECWDQLCPCQSKPARPLSCHTCIAAEDLLPRELQYGSGSCKTWCSNTAGLKCAWCR